MYKVKYGVAGKFFFSTIIWATLNTIFGLIPLWILLYGTLMNYKFDLKEVIIGGILIFFCMAIMGSILADYILSKLTVNKIAQLFIYSIPLVVILLVYPLL